MQVYSLVSRAKRRLPDLTQLPPGHRTCSFISRPSCPGSIQLGCQLWRTALFKHTSLHCPTQYLPGSRECACEQRTMPRSTTSERIQRSRGSNSRSLACASGTLPLIHDALFKEGIQVFKMKSPLSMSQSLSFCFRLAD